MSAAASQILTGAVDARAVAVVALCTAAAYWFDDVLDSRRDHAHSPVRFKLIAVLICLACAGILALRAPPPAIALLIGLGIITVTFCALSFQFPQPARPVLISLVWSLLVVLTPVLWRAHAIRIQEVASIGFIWLLMIVVSAMWAAGEHSANLLHPRLLLIFCAFAGALVVYGIVAGYFAWMNIALLAACAANAFFVIGWNFFQDLDRRVYNELMILMNIIACLLAIGAYTNPQGPFWPLNIFDCFELLALVVFFGNIGQKILTSKSKEHNGDLFDLLLILGLGIFAFQIILSATHLQLWLLPPLHRRLFASTTASAAGATITILALLLQTSAYAAMGRSWRLMARSDEDCQLITSGPFSFSRNPIYISAELYILGTFLMSATPVFALLLALAPVFVHRQIRREEDYLAARCGPAYLAYSSVTPRYIRMPRHPA
jgi:protein-S-isoprenylcysteine O-methyltransferase Ste14